MDSDHSPAARIGSSSSGQTKARQMECAIGPLSLPKKFQTKIGSPGVACLGCLSEVWHRPHAIGVVELCLVTRVEQLRAKLADPIPHGGRPPPGKDRDGGLVSYRKILSR